MLVQNTKRNQYKLGLLQDVGNIEDAEYAIVERAPRPNSNRLIAFDLLDRQFVKLFRLNEEVTRELIEIPSYLTIR